MRLYEGMFILNDARCTDDYNGTVEIVHQILKQRGAEIVDSRKWDERKLAYRIRGHHRGVYVLIHFNASPESITAIRRQMRLAADVVLRDLIVVDEDGITLGSEKEAEHAARRQQSEQRAAAAAAAATAAAAAPAAPASGAASAPGEAKKVS